MQEKSSVTDRGQSALTVSVILPTFNRAHLITESIDSLLAQTADILEIIIVDDGSTDNTREVLASYADRVTLLTQQNGGKLSALNHGFSRARGDLIWIMDDDDIAPADALERLLGPFREDPETRISYGALRKFTINPETGAREFLHTYPYPPEDGRSFFVHVLEDCFITGQPCLLVRRSCYEAIGPMPEEITISEDYAVLMRLARRFDAHRVDAVTLLQRQHEGPRGPKDIRYAADTRYDRWCAADTTLMEDLLPRLSLGEFLDYDAPAVPTDPAARRQAYFQKSVIAARKKLWPAALSALRAGVAANPEARLRPVERTILSRMLGCRYGVDEVIAEPGILDEIRAALGPLAHRKDAIAAIASLLPFLVKTAMRQGDHRRAWAKWSLYWRLTGLRTGVRTGVQRLLRTS